MSFRFILSQWLASQAGAAVRAEINERLRESTTDEVESEVAVEFGCVFSTASEAGGLFDMIKSPKTTSGNGMRFHCGSLGSARIAIVESGRGAEKASTATEALLEVFRPQRLLAAGFASALDSKIKTETIIIPSKIINAANSCEWNLWQNNRHNSRDQQNRDNLSPEATLLSLSSPPVGPKRKRELFDEFHAELTDTDSFAISQVAQSRNVPFMVLKIVLDTADEEIPLEVRHLSEQGGTVARKLGATFGAIFNRPSSALDLIKMKERSLLAADRLGKEIKKIFLGED